MENSDMTDSDLQQYVNQKIASGQFGTIEEFAAEAIRVYRKLEAGYGELRELVQSRIAQADSDSTIPLNMAAIKQQLINERVKGSPNPAF
jgi:hypothetical protein